MGILDERFFGEYRNEYSISLARQSNSVIICGQKQPVTGQSFVGECGLQISNAVLYHDFVNFFDYAKRNQYIYDTENSLSILRELALGYSQPNLFAQAAPDGTACRGNSIPPSGEKIREQYDTLYSFKRKKKPKEEPFFLLSAFCIGISFLAVGDIPGQSERPRPRRRRQ